MKHLILAALSALSSTSFGQIRTNNKVMAFNRAEGAAVYESYAQNSSFDKNTVGCTAISGSAPTITTALALIGKGSIQFSGSANTDQWRCRTKAFPTIVDATKQQGAGLNGQNCQAKFIYSSAYGGPVTQAEFTGYVANSAGTNISGTQTLSGTYDISNPQAARTGLFFFPCPYNATAANTYVDLIISHTTGTNSSLVMDSFEQTFAKDLGSGVPNNTFTANISNTGVVTSQGESFVQSVNLTDSSLYGIVFTPGKFTFPPACTATQYTNPAPGAAETITKEVLETTAGVSFRTGYYGGSFIKAGRNFVLTCNRQGSDFVQSTITPSQWNFDWTTCPSISGTFTNTTYACKWMRKGGDAYFDITWNVNSAPAAASFQDLTLPITIDTNKITGSAGNARITGTGGAEDAGVAAYGPLVPRVQSSTTVRVSFTSGTSTLADLTNTTPFGWNTGDFANVKFSVPVSGWTENQNAPQLTGSLTTNSSSSTARHEFASISPTCTSSPCTIAFQSGGISSVVWNSTGSYTVNFSGNASSSNWGCNVMAGGTAGIFPSIVGLGTTFFSFNTYVGTTLTNSNFFVMCDSVR